MNDLLNYGVLGICVLGLAGYILRIESRHKEERDEWKRSIDRQFDRQNENIEKNTSILSALKTLLETRNGR
jgi:hypothetical protein